VAKSESDYRTLDLFDGRVSSPRRVMPADVRRVPRAAVRVEFELELCAWCGVDRAGGCGACSDLKYRTR
jgi:hypothetical protein